MAGYAVKIACWALFFCLVDGVIPLDTAVRVSEVVFAVAMLYVGGHFFYHFAWEWRHRDEKWRRSAKRWIACCVIGWSLPLVIHGVQALIERFN